MWKIVALHIIVNFVSAQEDKPNYNEYKIWEIIAKDDGQVKLLLNLNTTGNFYYLNAPVVDKPMIVILHLSGVAYLKDMLWLLAIDYREILGDPKVLVNQYIDEYERLGKENVNRAQLRRSTRSETFDFNKYHTLEVIYENLNDLAKRFPNMVQIIVGGRSYKGRQIKGVKISYRANNPGVFLEGGIHGNEWISPVTVMYILHQLLTSNDADVRELAERHDWYIFPLFNPDGYVYAHTTNRLWFKTLKPFNLETSPCIGVDLDKNWNYRWNTAATGADPCMPNYAGSKAFSEIELESMSQYIDTLRGKFYAYISFRGTWQYLLVPFGWTKTHILPYEIMTAIATNATKALAKRYGTIYQIGSIAERLGVTTGCSLDYIFSTYGIPIVFQYQLRDRGRYGPLLPSHEIIPTGQETLDSLVAMFKAAKEHGYGI